MLGDRYDHFLLHHPSYDKPNLKEEPTQGMLIDFC